MLERGAPGTAVGGRTGFSWAVLGWALGWVHTALASVPAELRTRGGLIIAAAAIAIAEDESPGCPGRGVGVRRVSVWARTLERLGFPEVRNRAGVSDP